MADINDIIKGISQVMANSYDGATDEDGKPKKMGLKRDEQVPFTDRRVIDGFAIKLSGNKLLLTYQAEILLTQVHDKKFEEEIESTIAEVISFIKKEYKSVTGDTLTLKSEGEVDIEIHSTSRVRTWVQASCLYEVGGMDADDKDKSRKDLDKAVKDWLEIGKEKPSGVKKSKNDTR